VQLHSEFDFDRAAGVVPYLGGLGVSEIYLSPILQAAPGSTHGYDVVDHSRLSAGMGGEAGFERLVAEVRSRLMGVTLDIVPNHMATDGRGNRWWWDVLENGPSSLYASYFDIDWPGDSSRHEQTVLVPVLGDRYGHILEAGEIEIVRTGGSFTVTYFDHELPLSPRTFDTILIRAGEESGAEGLLALGTAFGQLPHAARTDANAVRLRHEQKETLTESLAALLATRPELGVAVDRVVAAVNSDPDELDRLLCRQNYRLAYWRAGREELDYRRFFNIETLVGLRVEDDEVFAATHETIARLARTGDVTGLRVDHVDGLRDPEGYLQRLRRLAPDGYVVVEKILDPGEEMPPEWPVQGTTGYDFMTQVANAFVDPAGEEGLGKAYAELTGETGTYPDIVRAAKFQIMTEELAPEVERLARLLHSICDGHRQQRDRTRGEVHTALEDLLASFPVYRTYTQPGRPVSPADTQHVERAVATAKAAQPDVDPELLDFIGELLLLRWPGGPEAEFAQIFPQVSAPVMAKGAEDTAFYRYHRLVSLNEVGGDPGTFGRPLADFHAWCARAAERTPLGMLTLATHDTKRSPDVRARIGLLSELPAEWQRAATTWFEITDGHTRGGMPDANTRYLLFQTLVGAWPIGVDRLTQYMEKATREAKVHTSWADPDPEYEESLRAFIAATVSDARFVSELEGFLAAQNLMAWARATALSQTSLLLTCPGVPDIYQGTEIFEHSLVDPDNRRPVDFEALARGLETVRTWDNTALSARPLHDLAKLWLTHRILDHRARRPELYTSSTYEPLRVGGSQSSRLIAFDRGGLAVVAARHLTRVAGGWDDTFVELPPGDWRAVVGAWPAPRPGGRVRAADVLGAGPVAVLER
jgi:(1->4)-alpha-D-glucan 1-alpha-D-glucosylmutase